MHHMNFGDKSIVLGLIFSFITYFTPANVEFALKLLTAVTAIGASIVAFLYYREAWIEKKRARQKLEKENK